MRLVITSLEHGLLDQQSDSYAAARQALAALERRSIPLILVSSRTRSEMDPIRQALELEHPFVVEGGLGVWVPEGYFPDGVLDPLWQKHPPFWVRELGSSYEPLRQVLRVLRSELQADLVGYGDWTTAELAVALGSSVEVAAAAQQRNYSEIFRYDGDPQLLQAVAAQYLTPTGDPLQVRRLDPAGESSLWRLTASRSPDPLQESVGLLLDCYREHLGAVELSLGIGSTPEDGGFLVLTQRAVALPSPTVQDLWAQARGGWILADLPGSEGWNDVVLTWLEETDGDGDE